MTRTRIATTATLNARVNGQRGDWVLVVTAALSASLVAYLRYSA